MFIRSVAFVRPFIILFLEEMDMEHMDHGSPPSTDSSMNGTMDSSSNMVMHMSFFWGEKVTILFSSWTTSNAGEYAAAIIATFLFCLLHEFLTTLRVTVIANATQSSSKTPDSPGNSPGVPLLQRFTGQLAIGSKLIGSLLYGVNVASAYILMLVIMTFNLGLFLAVVLGLAAGFLLFGFGRSTPSSSSELCCPM